MGTARGTFGLSNGATAAAITPMASLGTQCVADSIAASADSNDYIIIPNGVAATAATAATAVGTAVVAQGYFSAAANGVADATICSRVTPFKISVFTDGAEAVKGTAALKMSKDNEASAGVASTPTGTMGFSLGFSQIAC